MRHIVAALLLLFAALVCANVAHACNNTAIERVALGQHGEAVQNVQACLTTAGYPTVEDGIYGPATQRSVDAFYAREFPGVRHGTYLGPRGRAHLKKMTVYAQTIEPTDPEPAAPAAPQGLSPVTKKVPAYGRTPTTSRDPDHTVEPDANVAPHTQAPVDITVERPGTGGAPEIVLPTAHTPRQEASEFVAPHTQAPSETPVVLPESRPDPSTPPLSVERTTRAAPEGVATRRGAVHDREQETARALGCPEGDGECVADALTRIYADRTADEHAAHNSPTQQSPIQEHPTGADPPDCAPERLLARDAGLPYVNITGCPQLHLKLRNEALARLCQKVSDEEVHMNAAIVAHPILEPQHHA